jgi:excisionase family DNA binding protein
MSALPAAPLTVKDVAALASVHEHTVRRAIRDGHLEAFRRLGSTVYTIHPAAFERWAYGERVAPRAHPAHIPASRSAAATAAGTDESQVLMCVGPWWETWCGRRCSTS